jgi:excisionase family DNA binding protein
MKKSKIVRQTRLPDGVYNARMAATYCRMPYHAFLYTVVYRNRIRYSKPGRDYLFARKDLDAYLKSIVNNPKPIHA